MSTSLTEWLAHALGFGLIAAVACGAVLITVQFLAPYAFLNDYPEDIRDAAPKPTPAQKRAGTIGGIVFMLSLLGGIGSVPWSWAVTHPGSGPVELALMALVANALFALFDVLVVDWLVICTLRPRRLVYPGTENCAGWGDYSFHVAEQLRLRALIALLALSAFIGPVIWWLA